MSVEHRKQFEEFVDSINHVSYRSKELENELKRAKSALEYAKQAIVPNARIGAYSQPVHQLINDEIARIDDLLKSEK